jgi:pseudouridine kinase
LNVDRILRLDRTARLGTSNPAVVTTSPGGVARNVAEHLARLGDSVALWGAVGDDDAGRRLLANCAALGIDTSGVVASDRPTGSYTAVIDPDGSLVIGIADTAATEAMRPAERAGFSESLRGASWLFVDANLTSDAIASVLDRAAGIAAVRIAANAVSVPKAGRLVGSASRIDLLFCAHDEAEALAQHPLATPAGAAAALAEIGVSSAVVTVGGDGAWWFDSSGSGHVAARAAAMADATGAGDALMAATIHALAGGAPLADAVHSGVGLAAETVAHLGAGGADDGPQLS